MTGTIFTEQRLASTGLSTVSELLVAGQRVGFTLEPGAQTPLHPRKPAGRYQLVLRQEGGIYQKYRQRFGADWFAGIPQILVPGRSFVEVHIGNTLEDTEACSLLGAGYEGPAISRSQHYEVVRSEEAFRRVYPMIRAACLSGPAWWVTLDVAGIPTALVA